MRCIQSHRPPCSWDRNRHSWGQIFGSTAVELCDYCGTERHKTGGRFRYVVGEWSERRLC